MVDIGAHGHRGQLDLDYVCPCYELGLGAAPPPCSGREADSGVPWPAGGHQQY